MNEEISDEEELIYVIIKIAFHILVMVIKYAKWLIPKLQKQKVNYWDLGLLMYLFLRISTIIYKRIRNL